MLTVWYYAAFKDCVIEMTIEYDFELVLGILFSKEHVYLDMEEFEI